MTINPIRMGLLHNGQIVIIAGSENNPTEHAAGTSVGALWNLQAQSITIIPMLWDVFCNGGSFFADGRCMTFGGTDLYDSPFEGDARTTVFDPTTQLFTQLQSMSAGRWYATATTLGNGRVMVFSGLDGSGNTNQNVELYTVGSGLVPHTSQTGFHPFTLGCIFYRTATFSFREVHGRRGCSTRVTQPQDGQFPRRPFMARTAIMGTPFSCPCFRLTVMTRG